MPPYDQLGYEAVLFMCGIGIVIALLVILARGSLKYSFTFRRRADDGFEQEIHEFGGGVRETNRPLPLLIWVVFFGYFIWAIGYVIYISQVGY